MSVYNFGVKGCNPTKLWNLTCLEVWMLTQVQLLGASLPLKFGKTKTFKNRCDLRQLSSLSAYISETDKDSDKI